MVTYKRPGVFIQESLTPINTDGGATADAAAAFAGSVNRGPTTPTLVNNWSEYVSLFGDFDPTLYLPQAVYQFFLNGGGSAYIQRFVGTGATAATRSINDSAVVGVPTLKVDAANPGTWGNSIYLDIDSDTTLGRFDLAVKFGGVAAANIVETFTDLSMDPADKRYAPTLINSYSRYVVATDLASATAAPNNVPLTQAGTALTTGTNGTAPDATAIAAQLTNLRSVDQPLVLALPGETTAANVNAAIQFAEDSGTTFVVVDTPSGQTSAQAITYAQSLTASSYAAVYYPWIVVNDPTKAQRVTVAVPPSGAVVAQYFQNDVATGPFHTPAGIRTALSSAVSLETVLKDADYDALNTGKPPVNAIKPVTGFGICIFGARTLRSGFADKYIAARRSLIYIEKNAKDLTRFAVFEPNDARLWASITSALSEFLQEYWQRGGLRGATPADAFFVRCDSGTNPISAIQNGQVNVEIGVALEYPAEFVIIRLGQFEGGTNVSTEV